MLNEYTRKNYSGCSAKNEECSKWGEATPLPLTSKYELSLNCFQLTGEIKSSANNTKKANRNLEKRMASDSRNVRNKQNDTYISHVRLT